MAANRSLGTLTLDLIAKIGGFTEALDRASRETDRRLSEIEKRAEKFGEAIGEHIRDAIAAIGVTLTVGGFLEGLKDSIDYMDELGKSAQKVDLPVEEFSTLAGSARLSGIQLDTLTATLGRLTKAQADALDKTSQQSKIFKALGIDVADANGKLRSSEDVLKDFADRFVELKGSPDAIAAGIQLFGKQFQDLIPFISKGSEGIDELQGEVKELGGAFSTEATQGAAEFNDHVAQLKLATQGLFAQIAQQLLPVLDDWLGEVKELAKENDKLDGIGAGLARTLEGLAAIGHVVAAGFKFISAAIQTLTVALAANYDAYQTVLEAYKHPFSIEGWKKAASDLVSKNRAARDEIGQIWEDAGKGIDESFDAASKNVDRIMGNLVRIPKHQLQSSAEGFIDSILGPDPKGKADGLAAALHGAFSNADRDAKEAQKAADALAASWGRLNEAVQKVRESANPETKAYNDFADTIRNIDQLAADAIKKGADVADVQRQVADAVSAAQQKLATDLAKPMKAAHAFADTLDEELQARKDLIQSQVDAIGMGEKEAANQQELIKVRQQGLKAIADLQKQYQNHPEAFTQEQYEAELAALKKHWEDMYNATKDGQDRITAAQEDWKNGVSKGYQDWLEQASNTAAAWAQITQGALNTATDDLSDFLSGSKSAKDAFMDFIDSTEAAITKFVAQQLLKQLLKSIFGDGTQGSSGGETPWYVQAIGAIFGGNNGGKAIGGLVAPNSLHRVNEHGPELLSVGGKDFLMMGDRAGHVTPNSHLGGGKAVTQNNNFFFAAPTSQKTQTQVAQRNAYEIRRAQRLS